MQCMNANIIWYGVQSTGLGFSSRILKCNSPVEAYDAIVRTLVAYEAKYNMSSVGFFSKYQEGKLDDSKDFVEWAGDYQHYISL